ncbi:hypothetical protein AVEN_168449-1 [Araneus ventricosus]|uniref:Uncharacterized protein n=1 Tax=Araneus ventricosus TaxID=182803 RepID=A0A4Y2GTJ9_ARAVE|nr:hypothetical protein AVEN_168449-1 [Araneus ventricosus]
MFTLACFLVSEVLDVDDARVWFYSYFWLVYLKKMGTKACFSNISCAVTWLVILNSALCLVFLILLNGGHVTRATPEHPFFKLPHTPEERHWLHHRFNVTMSIKGEFQCN